MYFPSFSTTSSQFFWQHDDTALEERYWLGRDSANHRHISELLQLCNMFNKRSSWSGYPKKHQFCFGLVLRRKALLKWIRSHQLKQQLEELFFGDYAISHKQIKNEVPNLRQDLGNSKINCAYFGCGEVIKMDRWLQRKFFYPS